MNKNRYKVIYNKHRGQMVAVAENTTSAGKTSADRSSSGNIINNLLAKLPILTSSIMLGLGLCLLVNNNVIASQIHADPSAPKNQQPTVLQSANGTPQINIRTPSKRGVSINQYRQMDIDHKGAILNNSRKSTQTQQAGWVQGNPWLATGEARIIVNQINSSNPSQLNGYLEVAGRRAEVIIANPSGININGGGFINAAGVTLTTGRAQINDGQINSIQINQGNININGQGLDSRDSDYTHILSKAAQINAGIWANNLNIISGSNHIDAETQHITPSATNNDPKPSIAIDTGKLGGMYAGKIVLISNDKGVGINNAGQIFAGAGSVTISADGHLDNSGSIIAADKTQTSANIASASLQADSIHNSGTVSSQGQLQLQSQQLSNSGLLTSADELNIRNRHSLSNSGEINGSRLDIISNSIHNHNGKLIQSGQQGLKLELDQLNNQKDSLIGYAPLPSASDKNPAQPDKPAQPPAETDNQNKAPSSAEGAGQTAAAPVLPNKTYRTGQIISHSQINNQNGQIIANGGIDLTAHNGLSNQGTLNLNQLQVNGELLDNHQGKLNTNQASIHTTRVDNRAGQISSSGQIQITGQALDNRQGRIQSAERIAIDSAEVNNSDNGTIAAQQQLHIHSTQLNNSDKGQLWSGGQTAINTEQLHNTHGAIDSDSLQLTTDELNNQHGAIRSEGKQQLSVRNQLHNQNGQIGSNSTLNITAGNIDNSQGKISAGKQTELHTGALNNQQGSIDADSIDLTADSVDNHSGAIRSNQQLSAQISQHINNQNGQISSAGTLQLNSHTLDNSSQGKIIAGKQASIHNHSLNNQQGSIDADSIEIQSDSVNNHSGAIRANQQLSAQISQQLDNRQGQISSAKDLSIHDQNQQSLSIDNSDNGKILAGNDLNIQSKQLNNPGSIDAGRHATIQLHNDFSVDADIKAGGRLHLSSQGNIKNNHTLSGSDSVILNAANIDNQASGIIQSNHHTELQAQDSLTNRGLINSNGTTLVQSGNSINNIGSGRIYGNHVAIGTHNLINQEETIGSDSKAAVIAARERLDIGATHIINKEHALLSSEGDIAIGGALNEQHQATGMADSLINSSARIEAQRDGNIAVKELHNLNNHFKVEEYLESDKGVKQYQEKGNPEIWEHGVDGKFKRERKKLSFTFNDGSKKVWKKYSASNVHWWDFNRKIYKQKVTETAPSEIIIGGNLSINGDHWVNENSHIIVGGTLFGAENLNLENRETKGQQRIEEHGEQGGYKYKNPKLSKGKIKTTNKTSYDRTIITSHEFDTPTSTIQQHVATGGNQGVASTANPTGHEIGNINSNNQTNTSNNNIAQQQQHIQTLTDINTRLPNSSLYHTNPNNNGYLVETDPAFTNKHKWLGSDYMLSALGQDPNKMQKRLGDGYYEQRLINEQIANLTGFRRLGGYQNDEEQYKALMNAGVTYAQQYNLTPGIALSAEQMAQLTSDIVWLVNQTVTLADGSQQTVLVPKVYLIARTSDVNSAGSLISARNISLQNSGNIDNQGTLAAQNILNLGAQNINNSGLISGNKIALSAKENINFNGGTAIAQDLLALKADQINLTTTTASYGDQRNGGTVIDRTAGLYVTGNKDSILTIDGKKGINTHGADIINTADNGLTQLRASDGSINLGTVSTATHMTAGERSDKNHWINHYQNEVGTNITAVGDINLLAGDQLNIRQSDIDSYQGNVNLYGKNSVNISEGRQQTELDHSTYDKSSGFLSKKTTLDQYQANYNEAVASNITGAKVNISSDKDINIRGSNIISDNGTLLHAGNDINISAAENHYTDRQYHKETKSGLMGSGGIGFTIGSQKESDDTTSQSLIHSGSSIGSLSGNTNIIAGNHYSQTGSSVSSPKGDINIIAKQIDISAAEDQHKRDNIHTFEKSGLTVAVNVPIVSAIQDANTAIKRVGKSKNDRVNAMAAFNAGMDSYKAGQAIADAGNNPQSAAQNVSVSITVGQQKSRSESHSVDNVASASNIHAGGQVNLLATGAGQDSNINIIGSDVSGNQGTHLQADNQINLLAAEQSHSERSKNSSSGWNAGVAINYGSGGASFGVTAGANRGKGHANGDETSYRNSHIGSLSGNTSLISGGATNIKGAQVTGKGVSIDAAELNIESLQDTAKYDSKQQNIGGQITVGYGVSGTANYSKSKIKADYAGVTEQSGIIAGDNGYQIKVKGNTDLKGAIITSTQAAEAAGKNQLITGSLTSSDIKNHSDYKGSSIGIGVSGNYGGGWTGQSKDGVNKSLGFGHDSGHDSSTTHSGINTNNIIITDETAQQQKTGKNAAQTIAGIHTDTTSDNYADKAGYLANNFDKDKVQEELDLQREVSQEFDQNRQELKKELLQQARKKYEEAEEERRKNGGLRTEKSIELEKEGRRMEQNIAYLDTALGILWAGDIGTAALETAALHADYAKNAARHITAGKVYKVTCSGAEAQYFCKDINNVNDAIAAGDQSKLTKEDNKNASFEGTAIQIYDYGEIMDGKSVLISNPGIYNNEEAAFRNAIKQNPEAAAKGNLYVVVNNPTVEVIPGLGEVGFYALYDKINELLGGRLPLTNAEKTNAILKQLAKQTGTEIIGNNHSRGSMTDKVSSAYLQNKEGETGIPISRTKYLGPAAHIRGEYEILQKNGYIDEDNINSTLFLGNHNTDFVGGIVGLNPVTAGECIGNPLGSCYSHSSYNGDYYLNEFLQDPYGNEYIDKNTGEKIPNPEFDKIRDTVVKPEKDQNDRYNNPTLAQAVVIDADGYINLVDRQGKMTTLDKWTHRPIRTTQIPIHEVNGKRYFNFEGKRYHADPPR
ncbi:hemagglutinin repeat-containing protein [Snodgrassella communis]|uniref:hemagglutinin repeat-containing protein n=2 Tax=Snodgrassella communis TaxID=2946699 RepID=UPI001EF52F05|nr:hemagglutinin repeat-containing protein [Snodgrassella communis]